MAKKIGKASRRKPSAKASKAHQWRIKASSGRKMA